ncbi:MAG: Ig-like domain-containing protein [Bacteroidales bacterium]|nr:Ig-like domain-containing protein [Bacteroidales bacterium]
MKYMQAFKKSITTLIAVVFSVTIAFSAPTWTRVNYTSSTAFIGKVMINYYDKTFPITVEVGDYIGAFVGDECRMVAEVFSYKGGLYVSSVIHGGEAADMQTPTSTPEEVEFKVWDKSADKLVDATVLGTLFTKSAGEIFDYEIGKPNTGSELGSLSVGDFVLSPDFTSTKTEYTISVAYGTALPAASLYKAVAKDSRATVKVTAASDYDKNGEAVSKITVTAEDGTITVYNVTFKQADCPSVAPLASEIPNVSTCTNDVADLKATFASKSDVAVWYSDEFDGEPIKTANVFEHGKTEKGTYTYYVARNDGSCESTKRLEVTLKIVENPTPVIKGLESAYCNDDATVNLSFVPEGGVLSLNGVAIKAFNPADAKVGLNNISYKVVVDGCEGSAIESVNVNATPIIDLSSVATTACVNQEIALSPSAGTWMGTGVSGKTFKSTIDGEYTLTYSETEDGCSASDEVTISVVKVASPTVTSASVELNGKVPALTASASGTISWYEKENGDAVFTGKSFIPEVATNVEKVFTYYVSNTSSGCESEKVPVTLSVTSCTTEAPSIAEVEPICEGDAFPTLTATGSNITWYDAITDGTKLGTGATYSPTSEGTYYASQNTGCEGARASVKVTVKAKPVAPKVTSASSCAGAELVALTSNENADWYSSKKGTPIVTNVKSYTPESLTETTNFYVNRTENGCTSDFSEAVYTITPLPDAPLTDATKACFNEKDDFIVRISGSLASKDAVVQWYDENNVPKGTSTIQEVAVTTPKEYMYSVTQTVGNCTSKVAYAVLTVNALPNPKINLAGSYCSDSKEKVVLSADLTGGDFDLDGKLCESFVPSSLEKGMHTVTYTYEDDNECYVDVEKQFSIDDCSAPDVTLLSLNETSLELVKGDTYTDFVVTIAPDDAPQTVSWESSNTSVVTVDAKGNVKAVGAGSAVITVTSTYTKSKSAVCQVKVIAPVESVVFNNEDDLQVDEGGFIDMSSYLVVNPENASIKTVTWKVSSSDVTISNSGVLTAGIVSGDTDVTVTVTVTSEDGSVVSSNVNVTIVKNCSLSAPVVSNANQSICEGEGPVTFNASGDVVAYWVWENESGKVVNENSSFETNVAGTYFVYQQFGECSGTKTKVSLSVNENPQPQISVESSYCNDAEMVELVASPAGGTFTIDNVTKTSINPRQMTVGKHTIVYTYTDKNKCSGSDQVTISIDDCSLPPVTSLVLSETNVELQKEESVKLSVSILPEESPKTVNWKSSNTAVATVDDNGNVKAVGKGTAIITATSTYTSSQSDECVVTVVSPLQSVSFTKTSVSLMAGKTTDLSNSYVIDPIDAEIVSITWSSSSSDLQVDNNGTLTAGNVDSEVTATVTLTVVSDEGVTKTAEITVTMMPFTIDLTALQVKISEAQNAIKENEYRRGNNVGNIPSASFEALQSAIVEALALEANPPSEQSTVDAQVILLNSAIKTFLSSEVPNKVSSIAFESTVKYMVVGEEYEPDLIFEPQGAFSDLLWTSSNSDVVRVYGSGKIVALKAGSSAVTASLPTNMTISARIIIIVSDAPKLLSVDVNPSNPLANELILTYSEEMDQPEAQIYTDLYIYGSNVAIYNIMNVQVDPKNSKRIIVTVGAPVDDPNDLYLVYNGKSLKSKAGGVLPSFEYHVGTTAIDNVDAENIIAYPTFADDKVFLSGLSEGMQIHVVSVVGTVVSSKIATVETEMINVSKLPLGTYYIIISNNDKKQKTKLAFVKK